jgi:hypothetical protein
VASSNYRTILGIVQFDVKDGEAAGKPVRNIRVNGVDRLPYSATLWPSHKDFPVSKNDVVVLEGKYTTSDGEKDGEKVTYHNLSVIRAKNLGPADAGVKPETDDNGVEPDADEIPF